MKTQNYESSSPVLDQLGEDVIQAILDEISGTREGHVLTIGPPPYRRVDCDGRALAFIRSRPRKEGVRIDISGLWRAPKAHRFTALERTHSGLGVLWARSPVDVARVVRFLADIVDTSRAALQRAAGRMDMNLALRGELQLLPEEALGSGPIPSTYLVDARVSTTRAVTTPKVVSEGGAETAIPVSPSAVSTLAEPARHPERTPLTRSDSDGAHVH